jgi:hypothetical protein
VEKIVLKKFDLLYYTIREEKELSCRYPHQIWSSAGASRKPTLRTEEYAWPQCIHGMPAAFDHTESMDDF